MTAKTPISIASVAQHLATYPLGDILDVLPLTAGSVQTNFLATTSAGRVICRLYTQRPTAAVRFELEVLEFLAAQRFPAPRPIKNRRGEVLSQLEGMPCVLFHFIDGEHVASPSRQQKAALIRIVARLNRLTTGFKPAHTPSRWNYTLSFCRQQAEVRAEQLGTPNARAKLAWYTETLRHISLPDPLPRGICHTDFHFSNILYQGEQVAGLLDFDDANYTCLIVDLAYLINPFTAAYNHDTWAEFPVGSGVFDFEEARWIAQTYAQERPLTPLEKRHSFDAFKLTVMIDCLWFYARGEAAHFYERHKIACLDALGPAAWLAALFGE